METKNINILSFFIRDSCKSEMGYLGTLYIVHIHLCCRKIFRFENGQFLVFLKFVSMGTRLLLGNTIQMAYFIFTKILNTANVVLKAELEVNVLKINFISLKPV